jgi:hypothetical protein
MTALFRVITHLVLVISYRHLGTTYLSHFQGIKTPESREDGTDLPLKMGLTGCPETPVRNYHYSLRNNPEERSSYLLRGGNLKSHNPDTH